MEVPEQLLQEDGHLFPAGRAGVSPKRLHLGVHPSDPGHFNLDPALLMFIEAKHSKYHYLSKSTLFSSSERDILLLFSRCSLLVN